MHMNVLFNINTDQTRCWPGKSICYIVLSWLVINNWSDILVSHQLKTDIHLPPSFKTFEAISTRIENNSFSGFVVCLYRLYKVTCQFVDEFQDLLENIIPLCDNLYILGDFQFTSR